jgi:hypothetical protein
MRVPVLHKGRPASLLRMLCYSCCTWGSGVRVKSTQLHAGLRNMGSESESQVGVALGCRLGRLPL